MNDIVRVCKFVPLNVSSKFAICGLPLRLDTYKYCSFGCVYCFANNREIMAFDKKFQVGDVDWLERKLAKVLEKKSIKKDDFLETLISKNITWHCGGMSDPFQPIEQALGITKKTIDITNKYGVHILFSTKADTTYDCDIRPDLHTFQLSITNVENNKTIEPNVPDIERRLRFYRELKSRGFKVGIRIQPFIPNITTIEIVKMFRDADHFTLEGIKLVPQNEEHKEFLYKTLKLKPSDFTQMGLLNLLPTIRLELYKPFIDYFETHNISYSIADNDLRRLSSNFCCCGDELIRKSMSIDTTYMLKQFGVNYTKQQIDEQIRNNEIASCKCNDLFASNRQEGCKTVQAFYDKRFYRKTSIFSPYFQYDDQQPSLFDYDFSEDDEL